MKCALSVLGICAGEFVEPLQSLPAERIPEIRKQLGIDADTLE
jgi:hypothetical protein